MNIKYLFTKRNFTTMKNKKNEFIVVHWVGAKSSAYNNARYFENTYRGASAHYFVDSDEVYQIVREKDSSWHCGAKYYKHLRCRNSNSIGIEMCCYTNEKGKLDVSEEVINKTVELVRELMAKYNIPIENVLRHYDITGKNCPAPFVQNNQRWIDFINRVKGEVKGKYKAGQVVEIIVPIKKAYDNGTESIVDDGKNQFWTKNSVIENEVIHARATIAFAQGTSYIVQIFDRQFWVKEENIVKEL
ncbi:MAG: N-acetylmuramoyl-L-alanine amidase [Clostridia bacterium]